MGPAGKKIAKMLVDGGYSGVLTVSLMGQFLTQDCPGNNPPPADITGDLYVDAISGNNSNNGETKEKAVKTITEAIRKSDTGCKIVVLKGRYNERPMLIDKTAISVIAEPGTVLDGTGQEVHSSSGLFVLGKDQCSLDGLEIVNSPASAAIITDCDGSAIYRCKLHASYGFGATTYKSGSAIIRSNDIYDNGYVGGGYGTHGVYLRLESEGTDCSHNNVYGNAGCSIHVNGQWGRHYDNVLIKGNFEFNNAAGFNFMNNWYSTYRDNISFCNRLILAPSNAVVEFTYDDGGEGREYALGSDRFLCDGNIVITHDTANGIQVDRGPHHGVTKNGYIGKCIIVTPNGIAHIEDWGADTMIDHGSIVLGRWTLADMKALFAGGEELYNNPMIPVDADGYCPNTAEWRACFDLK